MSRKEAPAFIGSRIFRRLFFSYVLLIAVFLFVYAVWYFQSYRTNTERLLGEQAAQQVQRLGMLMDQQLITAQGLCNSVNTSETCRSILQSYYVEHNPIDSMQLYRILGELTRIKGASSSMSVYTIMLGFQGDNRLFLPGTVLSVDGEIGALRSAQILDNTSVNELLGLRGLASIVLNKKYLIYGESYTAFNVGPGKGVILVLLEPGNLESALGDALAGASGFEVVSDGSQLFTRGELTGRRFETASLVRPRIHYRLYLPETHFRLHIVLRDMVPVFLVLMLGVLFIAITYGLSKKYYQPFFSIAQMVEAWRGKETNEDELERIYTSISGLIGERDIYREQVVTMSPYARQGALHQLISEQKETALEVDPDFRHAFLIPALLDIQAGEEEVRYRDIHSLLTEICRQMSNEMRSLFVHVRQLNQIYILLSSDDEEDSGVYLKLFRKLEDAVDDPDVRLTMGVGSVSSSIQGLKDAMEDAERALAQMVTGGRGSVFFFEDAAESGGCVFPSDAPEQLTAALRSGQSEQVNAFLDELYRENLKQRDPSPTAVVQLVEDLHLSVRSALRTVSSLSTTTMRVERMEMPYTAEEAFEYYRRVLLQAQTLYAGNEQQPETDADIETAVCSYIDEHITDPDLSLSGVADRFGISTRLIGVICKRHFGANFLQYTRDRQIHMAAEMLKTGDQSLDEIAKACGFSNVLTFRRNFKTVMGVNPSDYRG